MKKILIWDYRIPLRNSGGPSGYLYQIKQQLLSEPTDQIHFLSEYVQETETALSTKHAKLSEISKSNEILATARHIFSCYRITHNPFPINLLDTVNINEFTHIHFHLTIDYYNARHLLRNYKGIIVVTSHSPEPLSREITNKMFKSNNIIVKLCKRSIKAAENWAFRNADKIMFPAEEAMEPYLKDTSFRRIFLNKKSDIVFCPTAILPKTFDENYINNLRGKYNIPDDAFLISYIGRHNKIKGYDIIKNIATEIYKKGLNIYFIIAGIQGPLYKLENDKWIEIGWTDKASEIIKASDLFILPNRETYFDLVALEVLRSGCPILMSLTGGNKYFNNNFSNYRGIRFFKVNDLQHAIEEILIFKKIKEESENWFSLRESNIELWKNHFTLPVYINRYIDIL